MRHLGCNMDAKDHEKIVDKLMQYRGKIPQVADIHGRIGICSVYELRKQIDDLIWQIDNYIKTDQQGLIK